MSLSPPADGGELPPGVEQRNGQLLFTKVTRSDAGDYTCIASNSLQGEIRAVVTLTVAGKDSLSKSRGIMEGKTQPTPLLICPTSKVLVVTVHLRVVLQGDSHRLFRIYRALGGLFIAR